MADPRRRLCLPPNQITEVVESMWPPSVQRVQVGTVPRESTLPSEHDRRADV